MFLIDAVSKYRNTEHEMWDIYCERTRHAHDDAADYLCAAVETFLKSDDESFRDILNRACWNGEKKPTDEILVKRLKRRAKRIVKNHRPEFVTAETLTKRLKPIVKVWKSKPMSEEEKASFHAFLEEIGDKR